MPLALIQRNNTISIYHGMKSSANPVRNASDSVIVLNLIQEPELDVQKKHQLFVPFVTAIHRVKLAQPAEPTLLMGALAGDTGRAR